MQIRLQKYIADEGITSRRKAEDLIRAGKVLVNDKPASIGQKIDPEKDHVIVLGRRLFAKQTDKVVYAFHKPKGVTSTTRRFKNEKNILDFFPKTHRLFPAGRLDKDSRGLMVVTNDGDLANHIMHPSNKSEKEYIVTIDRPIDELSIYRLRKGIQYEGEQYKTISVRELAPKKLRFVLGEGKKRQIRMMLRACRYRVLDLERTRINDLRVDDLKPGQYRKLSDDEIAQLV